MVSLAQDISVLISGSCLKESRGSFIDPEGILTTVVRGLTVVRLMTHTSNKNVYTVLRVY